jgi:hypothetical protein
MANKIAQLNMFNKKNVSNKHLINEKIRLIQLAAEKYNNKLNYIHRTTINNHLEVNQTSFNGNKNVNDNKSNNISNGQKNIVSFMDCVILHKNTNYL